MGDLDKNFYETALERVRAMSVEDIIAALKKAGVVDADGHLAERFRPPEEEVPTTASQAD